MTARLHTHRPLWDGRTTAPLGLGTYLAPSTDVGDAALRGALEAGLMAGITLLDTSVNYRDQRSERVVGAVLRGMDPDQRAAITVCTKVGFVPWEVVPPDDDEAYYHATVIDAGLARRNELAPGGHCIAPRYVAWSVDRSLTNLGVDRLDLVYVHNPEAQRGLVDEETTYARLRVAFEVLEGYVAAGRVGVYGVATWNALRTHLGGPEHLSLERIFGAAREAGGEAHHFRVVQAPCNLLAPELITARTQSLSGTVPVSALAAAHALGLRVITSAPLAGGELRHRARAALDFARSLPGIACVLVGARTAGQVSLPAALLGEPPLRAPALRALLEQLATP
ncbi:MAG: aldo/keto reductase [Deltaproteobacteria bacterium]|nr:aldo/keto reductase [Myxococcales bacterium]MDP3220364.1 aldo/keto reductase [Deltaproteobacteria bacterium]